MSHTQMSIPIHSMVVGLANPPPPPPPSFLPCTTAVSGYVTPKGADSDLCCPSGRSMGVSYRVTFVATLILPSTKTTVAYQALEWLRYRLSPDVDDVLNSIMAPQTPFLPVLGDVIAPPPPHTHTGHACS